MAEYGFFIPSAGRTLIAGLLAGETLEISRVMVGSGKPQSQEKPHAQNLSCALRTSGPIFPGDEAGNGDLGPGGGQRITDSVNGKII